MKTTDKTPVREAAQGFEIKTVRTAKCQVCSQKIKTFAQQCQACRWLICEECEKVRGGVEHTCYLSMFTAGSGINSSGITMADLPTYEHKQPPRPPKKKARRSDVEKVESHSAKTRDLSQVTKAEPIQVNRTFEEVSNMYNYDGPIGFMFRPGAEFPELPRFQWLSFVNAEASYQVRLMHGFDAQVSDSSLSIYRDAFHHDEQAEEVFSFRYHTSGIKMIKTSNAMPNDIHANVQFQVVEPDAVFNITTANDYSIMLKDTEIVLFSQTLSGRDYIKHGLAARKTNMLVGSITVTSSITFDPSTHCFKVVHPVEVIEKRDPIIEAAQTADVVQSPSSHPL